MASYEDTAAELTSRGTIEEEILLGGEPFPIELRDITESELEELEERTLDEEGNIDPEAESDVMREAIEEYLVQPEVEVDDIPTHKRSQLWFGMQLTWSGVEDIQAAMEEMELPGNRM